MSLTDNINNVSFASSITIDKIVDEGSYSVTNSGTNKYSIPHGKSYPVIAEGRWSLDGVNFLPCGVEVANGPLVLGFPALADCLVWTDATNVYVWTSHSFPTDQTFTVEYQLESAT